MEFRNPVSRRYLLKRVGTLAVVAASMLAVSGVARAEMPSSIRVACVVPLSGGLAAVGQKIKKGLDQYVEMVNGRGGIGGKTKIEVVYGDSKLKPTEGAVVTQRLLQNQKIDYYIGNFSSSVSLATQPILARAGVMQATFSYAPELTRKGIRTTIRVGPYSRIEMVPLAKYATTEAKAKRFAVLALNNDWGKDMVDEFKRAAKKYQPGVQFVSEAYYKFGTSDFSSYLTKIKSLGVDGVVLMDYEPQAVQITKQFRDLDLKARMFGSDLYAGVDYGKATGDRSEGVVFTDFWWRSPEGAPKYIQNFYRDYHSKYGENPDSLSIWGRLAMEVYVLAAERAGTTDRDKVLDAVLSGQNFQTVIGDISFASCGQAKVTNGVGTWKNGKQTYLMPKGFAASDVGYCD